MGFNRHLFLHSRKPCAFLESARLGLGGSSSRSERLSKPGGIRWISGAFLFLCQFLGFDLCAFCCRGARGERKGLGETEMARNAVDKATSIDAQLRLLAPQKLSDDDKLVEYDALLLDRFLDILQDLHGEDIRETVHLLRLILSRDTICSRPFWCWLSI